MPDTHHLLLLSITGGLVLLVSWLPMLLKRAPLSLPIICVAIGFAASYTPILHFSLNQAIDTDAAEKMSEAVMLIALMGAGLRIDRPFTWKAWGSPWRLLLIAMPICIALVFGAAWGLLGMSAPAAFLLAAALAPTDPVLAGDIQTGPPGKGEDGETRFGLTAEAGLNDGLAFPFVALALALHGGAVNWLHWGGMTLAGHIVAGGAIGFVGGKLMGIAMFRLPSLKLSDTGEGLVAIGATFLIYGLASLCEGNGFIAVFVAALAIRWTEPDSKFHASMAAFAGQVERVLVMLILVVFGWGLGHGLLGGLGWRGAALAVALLFLFRPLAAWIAFAGSSAPRLSKRLMGLFGIRGIGTIYYLLYAFHRAEFAEQDEVWAIGAVAILLSIIVHGIVATPVMQRADAIRKRHGHKADHPEGEPALAGAS